MWGKLEGERGRIRVVGRQNRNKKKRLSKKKRKKKRTISKKNGRWNRMKEREG